MTRTPDVTALADRVYGTVVLLMRRLRREDDRLGFSSAQLSTITTLVANGAMTLGQLAEAEGVRPPTMSRRVAALEEAGLVIRATSADDGRVSELRHSSAAIRLLEAGRAARVEVLGAALGALDAADREVLHRALILLDRLATP